MGTAKQTILGFPLWRGKIKRRVAKKYFNRYRLAWMLQTKATAAYKLTIGDYVNDCSGFNGKIQSLEPAYRQVGKGSILIDVDLQTTNTGCSLNSCGVEPALSRELIETQQAEHLREWSLGSGGKTWFGDEWEARAEHARKILALLESGDHIADELGQRLPVFNFST